MSAPATRADDSRHDARLRRLVQAGYALQALSLGLGLFGDGVLVTALVVLLPLLLGLGLLHAQREALRESPFDSHARWQRRTGIRALLSAAAATLLLGPLVFLGVAVLYWAYALIGLWVAIRVARGVHALLKAQPLVTRSGKDE